MVARRLVVMNIYGVLMRSRFDFMGYIQEQACQKEQACLFPTGDICEVRHV